MTNNRQFYIDKLSSQFKGIVAITKSFMENEIYVSTQKKHIVSLCIYIRNTFKAVLSAMFCNDERRLGDHFKIYYVFSIPHNDIFLIFHIPISEDDATFPSLTPRIPAAYWYEREIKDMFGLIPLEHPEPDTLVLHGSFPEDTHPLRKDFNIRTTLPQLESNIPFKRVEGEGVFEIPVGPIHAGIIEPGHFRFSAVGDSIFYLDVKLFYTHKGTEKLFEAMPYTKALFLAERICGVCAASHAAGYSQAIEKVTGIEIPPRARFIRTVVLELERLYNHIGDIGNICAGAAFLLGSAHGARIRERLQQLNEAVAGNRYLRGIILPGGVRFDINDELKKEILSLITPIKKDFKEVTNMMFDSSSLLDRLETTGRLSTGIARGMGVVGVAARASGIVHDTRVNHPYAAYKEVDFEVPAFHYEGDVLARVRVRIDEIYQSIYIIEQCLEKMPEGQIKAQIYDIPAYIYALSYVESPRGGNIYWIMTDKDNMLLRYKIRSASFCNWPAIPYAIPGNIVPDFPLINKSFELCYSCTDL